MVHDSCDEIAKITIELHVNLAILLFYLLLLKTHPNNPVHVKVTCIYEK